MQTFDSPYMFLKVPPVMYREVRDFVYRKYCGHILGQAEAEIAEIKTYDWATNEYRKNKVETLEGIREECLKYTDKAKVYKTKSRTQIALNLDGWEYRDQVFEEKIEGWLYDGGIKVSLHFNTHKKRTGCWKEVDRWLQVDVPRYDPINAERLRSRLLRLNRTVRHELAHFAQNLLGYGTMVGGFTAGLPSRHIRDYEFCYSGYKWKGSRRFQQFHALRDVEYFPRLDDEIQMFYHTMKGIEDPDIMLRAVKLSTGQLERGPQLYPDYHELNGEQEDQFLYCRDGTRFFSSLKYEQPEKYRDAVRKFTKAMHVVGLLG